MMQKQKNKNKGSSSELKKIKSKNMAETTRAKTFDEKLVDMRAQLKGLATFVKRTKEQKAGCETDGIEDSAEVMANMTLAYRHLEDASMRIGKTIQARAGGVSVYDNTAVGTPDTASGEQTGATCQVVEGK